MTPLEKCQSHLLEVFRPGRFGTPFEIAVAAMLCVLPGRATRQILILITCRDEKQQVELLARFIAEGIDCRAMMA